MLCGSVAEHPFGMHENPIHLWYQETNKQTNFNYILYRNRETDSKIHKKLQKSSKSQGSEASYFLN